MEKEEQIEKLEATIESNKKTIAVLQEEILVALQEEIEAKKPKLRHGDFGINEDGHGRIVLFRNGNENNEGQRDDFGPCGIHTNTDVIIYGNIFDLLEEQSKDLTFFEFDVHRCEINTVEFRHAPIHIAGNWHTLAEAEEIWHNLGRLIATIKRKNK